MVWPRPKGEGGGEWRCWRGAARWGGGGGLQEFKGESTSSFSRARSPEVKRRAATAGTMMKKAEEDDDDEKEGGEEGRK